MMPGFEHIRLQLGPLADQILLYLFFRVARKQKGGFPAIQAAHHRVIVQIIIILQRGQHRQLCAAAQIVCQAGLRRRDRDTLRFHRIQQAVEYRCGGHHVLGHLGH